MLKTERRGIEGVKLSPRADRYMCPSWTPLIIGQEPVISSITLYCGAVSKACTEPNLGPGTDSDSGKGRLHNFSNRMHNDN